MSDSEETPIAKTMRCFDQEHALALRKIWFLGDVHGGFDHIGTALAAADRVDALPHWLVFLGDIEIDKQPLQQVLKPMHIQYPSLQFSFVHGNHDADTYDRWNCLHDSGDAQPLHGKVIEMNGVRVAGLGGNFLGRVWAPPSLPRLANRSAAMDRGPFAQRNGQRPNPKLNGAIYFDEVTLLGNLCADILVTHEAPSCHPYGWSALDQLAREMGVIRAFHGHTHDDRSELYSLQREQLGFDARAVDFRCIKNGLGEAIQTPI